LNRVKVWRETGGMRQEIQAGPHRLVADVDSAFGGEASGPTPHDYLAAALGSCVATAIWARARRERWPLDEAEVTVVLSHDDAIAMFDIPGGTKLDCRISLSGALNDAQRARLLRAAAKSPVSQALAGRIGVRTRFV
jgi:putative redox protein